MKTALITGANRGIGLEIARQLQQQDYQVIALCRQPSAELESLGVEIVTDCDVTDDAALDQLSAQLSDKKIDLLINNAGILKGMNLDSLDYDAIRQQFEVNAIAPLKVTQKMLPHLQENAKVAIITSRMGSMGDNTSGSHYGYRMSKAAVNMVGKSLSLDLQDRGIAVGLLHPGYVKTGMTGGNGEIEAPQAAQGLIQRMHELNLQNSGGFWHANGQQLPW
ncbi:SDR family oxidoreductase [Marinicella sp. W31]|uniref:SDR family oxidoreductase n=1 Tax=Marinicella sp. W31 TaxID=3023713 RepID=UPI003756B637